MFFFSFFIIRIFVSAPRISRTGEHSTHRRSRTHTRQEVEEGGRTERTHTEDEYQRWPGALLGSGKRNFAIFFELPGGRYIQL